MDQQHLKGIDEWLRQDRDRPLAEVMRPSNLIGAEVSDGLQAAGTNLLEKALASVLAGEPDRARRYVERAVQLLFDEHGQVGTAWWAAAMLTHARLADDLESCEPGDDSWLTAAESALAGADPLAAQALKGALVAVADAYQLTGPERERCRVAARGCDPDSWDVIEPAEDDERVVAVLDVVELTAAYATAFRQA